jgi:hypothetical protein
VEPYHLYRSERAISLAHLSIRSVCEVPLQALSIVWLRITLGLTMTKRADLASVTLPLVVGERVHGGEDRGSVLVLISIIHCLRLFYLPSLQRRKTVKEGLIN